MDAYSLFKFAVKRESEVDGNKVVRVYQFEIQPGSPWSEVESALDELKSKFGELQRQAEEQEKIKKDSASAGSDPIEPEIIS